MEYTSFKPEIIRDASKGQQSEKTVADGILHSAMLTSFQRHAIDGIVNSGIPGKRHTDDAGSTKDILTHKVSPSKTKQTIGSRHYPGSRYA